MNILHLSGATGWRGGEQQLAYLALELKRKGINQSVFCPKDSALQWFCEKNEIAFYTYLKKSSFSFNTAKILKNVCEKIKPNLIHTHDSHAHTFAVLANIIFGTNIPIIVSRRVDFAISKNLLSKIKYNHKSIKYIVCVSQAIADLTAPDIKDKSIIKVVHSGVDPNRFKIDEPEGFQLPDFFKNKQELFIGNVAAIAPHKDYFTFVDTAKILIQQGVKARFFIIGDGPLRAQIEAYILKQEMSEHIVLTGFLDNIPQILPHLDLFLITSKTEGLGTSILDAFAAGVPVVATNAGGIPEIVIEGKSGLLAPVQNPQAIADRIVSLIENPELKNRIIQGGKEILEEFSYQNTAKKTIELYEKI